jgi:ABC-2 type transport system permease protein
MKIIENLSVIWAVAAKDMVDAIKSRTTLSIIVGMFMVMLTSQAFPFLLKLSDVSRVVVLNPGDSQLLNELAVSERYSTIPVDSRQELEEMLVGMNAEMLGLVVPADFDQRLASSVDLELEGYVVWSTRSAAEDLGAEMEAELADMLGRPVRVRVEGNIIYPPAEGSGQLGMVAIALVIVLASIGGFMVPYLMFEEKQTHTMEVLLVSPASIGQIVTGKALAGLFYTLIAAAVAFVFNAVVIVHWGVAILGTLAGALLVIAVGLVLGSLFESAQQMSLLTVLPIGGLLLPVMLVALAVKLPPWLDTLLAYTPTVALGKIYLLSFSGSASLGQALPDLAIIVGWAMPIYAAVVWIVRRSDR